MMCDHMIHQATDTLSTALHVAASENFLEVTEQLLKVRTIVIVTAVVSALSYPLLKLCVYSKSASLMSCQV